MEIAEVNWKHEAAKEFLACEKWGQSWNGSELVQNFSGSWDPPVSDEKQHEQDHEPPKQAEVGDFEVVAPFVPEWIKRKVLTCGDICVTAAFAQSPPQNLLRILRLAVEEVCSCMIYLAGIRALPSRRFLPADPKDVNWLSAGLDAWNTLFGNSALLDEVNTWLSSPAKLGTEYQIGKRTLVDADEVVRGLQHHLGKGRGEARSIVSTFLREAKSAMSELTLVKRKTDLVVSPCDVGLGISQILPVLVNALGSTCKIHCIEQPELHLHPALQADLADVFIDSALGERKNTFLLETHSEHLILRILRRIRETTEGKNSGLPAIQPKDVAVLYVQPGPKGAEVIELPVTPDGDFERPWPGGFFAERFQELP